MEFERHSIIAIGSIYGVDILQDNVKECRRRLLNIFIKVYRKYFKHKPQCIDTIAYILSKNILWGDALTLKTVCGKQEFIRFAEWVSVNGTMIKRRDYRLDKLLEHRSLVDKLYFQIRGNRTILHRYYKTTR